MLAYSETIVSAKEWLRHPWPRRLTGEARADEARPTAAMIETNFMVQNVIDEDQKIVWFDAVGTSEQQSLN